MSIYVILVEEEVIGQRTFCQEDILSGLICATFFQADRLRYFVRKTFCQDRVVIYLGHILDISWAYIGHILGHIRP